MSEAPQKKPKPKLPASDEAKPEPLESIGRFSFAVGSVHPRQKQRLREVSGFFSDDVVERLLLPVARHEFAISLRLLDYCMTNWAKKTRVMIAPRGKPPLNLFSLYKDWLRFYRRRGFDPFCRRERIFFSVSHDGEDELLETTVAQLNFLYWADLYGILEYVSTHKQEIEGDMMKTLGESKKRRLTAQRRPSEADASQKRKRTELSRAPSAKCVVYPVSQQISFDAVEQ
jgi:hypothetical protein